jgi:hypothetical protein
LSGDVLNETPTLFNKATTPVKKLKAMKPKEAGFDGKDGIMLHDPCPMYPTGCIYKLLRGSKPPSPDKVFKNKLFWWAPEGCDPILYYANSGGEFFALDFLPVSEPFKMS